MRTQSWRAGQHSFAQPGVPSCWGRRAWITRRRVWRKKGRVRRTSITVGAFQVGPALVSTRSFSSIGLHHRSLSGNAAGLHAQVGMPHGVPARM